MTRPDLVCFSKERERERGGVRREILGLCQKTEKAVEHERIDVVGMLVTASKSFEKRLGEVKIRGRIEII